jgi:hypothetical protein
MTRRLPFLQPASVILIGMALAAFAGCSRKSGEAIVLEKEHIAAAEKPVTPSATPASEPSPDFTPSEDETPRPLAPDEIEVDGYAMKKNLRGTSADPRALHDEQWLVRVSLVSGGRQMRVPCDPRQYEKLRPGDHVEVTYREGNYTGTVRSAEIK